jgi:hypothetical protein
MRAAIVVWVALVAVSASACEKDANRMPAAKGSGKLTAAEAELLVRLPAGGNAVFGGNYFDLQQWMATSPLAKLSKQMDPVMGKWNECLTRSEFSMAGTGGFSDGELRMAMYMKGLAIDQVSKCSAEAGLAAQRDDDGQFVSVRLETNDGVPIDMPYLAVAGGVYTVVILKVDLSGGGGVKPVSVGMARTDLEREQAGLATSNLAGDARMTGWLAKVDRTRMFFFVGSGEGTPVADKVGMVYGGMSVDRGLDFDVTVELRGSGAVDEALRGWRSMRSELGKLPPSMRALADTIRAVRMGKSPDGLRVVVRLTDAQLAAAAEAMAPFAGGLGQ